MKVEGQSNKEERRKTKMKKKKTKKNVVNKKERERIRKKWLVKVAVGQASLLIRPKTTRS